MTRRRPHDPAKAAIAALERHHRDQETNRLEAMGATVNRDRAGHILSAYRSNVFTRLRDAKPRPAINAGQHDAAMQLVVLWAAWKGLDGGGDRLDEKVDAAGSASLTAALVTDRMLRAGYEVAEVLAGVGLMDRALLAAFMVATVEEDRPMEWRGIVQRLTGEDRRERQAAMVACALENLRRYFHEPRARAA